MPNITRRSALRLGAGAAGTVALGISMANRPASADPVGVAPTMVSGTFVSAARGGIPTNWTIARPPDQSAPLRPVIALHGKGSSAGAVMAGGFSPGSHDVSFWTAQLSSETRWLTEALAS